MASRYYDSHNDGEEIRPGAISKELRRALNLPDNDIPIWIYRMRALGYPPGWLKKAIVDTSDIFDTDSPTNDDASMAAGSKKRKNPSDEEIQYDHSKLIEYPGFNMPMPPNCHDYHYYVNMPAMLEFQQLEFAKQHMNAFKPAHTPKRIKSAHDSSHSLDISLNNASSTAIDPSISHEGPESPDESSSDEAQAISSVSSSSGGNEKKPPQLNNENLSRLSTTSLPEMKLVSKGSPMPKPVERAPLEKFSEGVVGELLYFENIPSSSGKFDSIRGLLKTIRRSKSENDTSFQSLKSDDE